MDSESVKNVECGKSDKVEPKPLVDDESRSSPKQSLKSESIPHPVKCASTKSSKVIELESQSEL